MKNAPAVAYSYFRFSSPQQARSVSIRRQTELRNSWLARNGVSLDTTLALEDKGRSAYTGEHRKNPDRHALAAFLHHVEKGRIPKGSYLIVESLDRLSREHIQPALILFLNLLQAGIRIVQLLPVEQVFDDKSEAMQIMLAVVELSRGNSESRMKSERIGRAWADLKRKAAVEKVPITPVVPAWLRVEGNKIVTIPARAAVVARVFKLAIGGVGLNSIAKKLTTEGVPTFGKSKAWNPSTLHKILHSRATVGEYQPRFKRGRGKDGDPVAGYFPAVVSEADWWAAQKALETRHEGGRRAVRSYNPFAGLLVDARDDGKIYMTGPSKRMNSTLVNYGATRGNPNARYVSFPANVFTQAVLSRLRELKASDIIDTEDKDAKEAMAWGTKRADIEARIAALQAELESGEGEVKSAVAALRKLETLHEEATAAEAAAKANAAAPLANAVGDFRGVIDVLKKNDNDETRARLKAALRRAIAEVRCLFVAHGRSRVAAVQVWFRDSEQCRNYLIAYTQGKGNAQVKTPAKWSVLAFREAVSVIDSLDLRNPKHAAALETTLSRLDVTNLTE